jgi:hypothetical protein
MRAEEEGGIDCEEDIMEIYIRVFDSERGLVYLIVSVYTFLFQQHPRKKNGGFI